MNPQRSTVYPRALGLAVALSTGPWAGAAGAETEPSEEPPREEQRIATSRPEALTLWEFSPPGPAHLLWNEAFAVGQIQAASLCSGVMISPHVFMTAAHCGGPEWTGFVRFFRIDEDSPNPGPSAQRLSAPYPARPLPWTSFDVATGGGDTQLWWLDDGPGGVPPGVAYGSLELREDPVDVNFPAYSFWINGVDSFPGGDLPATVLFSAGRATSKFLEPFRGPTTDYDIYGAPGASGSPVIIPGAAGGRIGGTTSCAASPEGPFRCTADTDHFLALFDADGDQALDAIEYDWLATRYAADFYFFDFNTPSRRAEWRRRVALPEGVGGDFVFNIGFGEWYARITAGPGGPEDRLWHGASRFRRDSTYRLVLRARGTLPGQRSYVKFRTDLGDAERLVELRPGTAWGWLTGSVHLDRGDYHLYLGTDAGTSLLVSEMAVVREEGRLNFETGAERRAWRYQGDSHPTSWGLRGSSDFSGVAQGPCPAGCLRNGYVALQPGTTYRLTFRARHVSGPLSAEAFARVPGGGSQGVATWRFQASGERVTRELTFTTRDPLQKSANAILFGTDGAQTFLVDDVRLEAL